MRIISFIFFFKMAVINYIFSKLANITTDRGLFKRTTWSYIVVLRCIVNAITVYITHQYKLRIILLVFFSIWPP